MVRDTDLFACGRVGVVFAVHSLDSVLPCKDIVAKDGLYTGGHNLEGCAADFMQLVVQLEGRVWHVFSCGLRRRRWPPAGCGWLADGDLKSYGPVCVVHLEEGLGAVGLVELEAREEFAELVADAVSVAWKLHLSLLADFAVGPGSHVLVGVGCVVGFHRLVSVWLAVVGLPLRTLLN